MEVEQSMVVCSLNQVITAPYGLSHSPMSYIINPTLTCVTLTKGAPIWHSNSIADAQTLFINPIWKWKAVSSYLQPTIISHITQHHLDSA